MDEDRRVLVYFNTLSPEAPVDASSVTARYSRIHPVRVFTGGGGGGRAGRTDEKRA